jgi:hypothetical protein
MTGQEDHDLSRQEQPPDLSGPPRRRRSLFSWWWVWIPVIVVVILWLGGWGFGDYGGPWGPKPQNVHPQISDPAVAILDFDNRGAGQGTFTFSVFSSPS